MYAHTNISYIYIWYTHTYIYIYKYDCYNGSSVPQLPTTFPSPKSSLGSPSRPMSASGAVQGGVRWLAARPATFHPAGGWDTAGPRCHGRYKGRLNILKSHLHFEIRLNLGPFGRRWSCDLWPLDIWIFILILWKCGDSSWAESYQVSTKNSFCGPFGSPMGPPIFLRRCWRLHHHEPGLPGTVWAAGGLEGPLPTHHSDGARFHAHHGEYVPRRMGLLTIGIPLG